MALEMKSVIVLGLGWLSLIAAHGLLPNLGHDLPGAPVNVFDITTFGAKPDGKTESALAMIKAWNAACHSSGPAKVLIPVGTFLAGEVVFAGPCTAPTPIVVEVQGTVLARTDLSLYTRNTWISIEHINCVVVTGLGTLNGQGEASWKFNDGEGAHLPDSLVFMHAANSTIENVHFCNSKGFHMKIVDSQGIQVNNIHVNAPEDSPNTDGIHISGSTDVTITGAVIGTGDDCISIGEGNNGVLITNVRCGPGHGISVGSLGKRPTDQCLKGVTVRNCTLSHTTNGARIKTYRDSPEITASDIVFEDIIMEDVKNPIIIDQNYASKERNVGSKVKISNVVFKNIRGTSISEVGVTFNCSNLVPCEGIQLADINLHLTGPLVHEAGLVSHCINAKPTFVGQMIPPPCVCA